MVLSCSLAKRHEHMLITLFKTKDIHYTECPTYFCELIQLSYFNGHDKMFQIKVTYTVSNGGYIK
jgi:hypothetical protein